MLIVHDAVPFAIVHGEFVPPTFTSVNGNVVGATPFTVRTNSATDCVFAEKYDCVERVLCADRAVADVPAATLKLRLTVTVAVGLPDEVGVGVGVAEADADGFGVGLAVVPLTVGVTGGVVLLPPHAVSPAADASAPKQRTVRNRTRALRRNAKTRGIIKGKLTEDMIPYTAARKLA
jgi:hypothetical protein